SVNAAMNTRSPVKRAVSSAVLSPSMASMMAWTSWAWRRSQSRVLTRRVPVGRVIVGIMLLPPPEWPCWPSLAPSPPGAASTPHTMSGWLGRPATVCLVGGSPGAVRYSESETDGPPGGGAASQPWGPPVAGRVQPARDRGGVEGLSGSQGYACDGDDPRLDYG